MGECIQYLTEGLQYKKAASGRNGKPSKFDNSTRYNLYAMSIEKCMMAIVVRNNDMADNHTFSDLIASVERHLSLPADLKSELLELEQVQTICSVFDYYRGAPTSEVVERLRHATERLCVIAEEVCSGCTDHTGTEMPISAPVTNSTAE
jgi:hypothetical protein